MLTSDRKRLEIFNRGIAINQTLKKSTRKLDTMKVDGVTFTMSSDSINFGSVVGNSRINMEMSKSLWDGLSFPVKTSFRNKFHRNIYNSYLKIKRKLSKKKLPPSEFFKLIKNETNYLGDLKTQKDIIIDYIKELEDSGQEKMKSKFLKKLQIINDEIFLRDNGFNQYLTEKNLVKFVLKSARGLKLDYILDFDRIIPKNVIETKNKAEELAVFDNYLILHYDPDSAKLLKKEVQSAEEKKDPIMFGVMEGSDKLYFIDDWVDEKCDLTYSKIIDSLGVNEKL